MDHVPVAPCTPVAGSLRTSITETSLKSHVPTMPRSPRQRARQRPRARARLCPSVPHLRQVAAAHSETDVAFGIFKRWGEFRFGWKSCDEYLLGTSLLTSRYTAPEKSQKVWSSLSFVLCGVSFEVLDLSWCHTVFKSSHNIILYFLTVLLKLKCGWSAVRLSLPCFPKLRRSLIHRRSGNTMQWGWSVRLLNSHLSIACWLVVFMLWAMRLSLTWLTNLLLHTILQMNRKAMTQKTMTQKAVNQKMTSRLLIWNSRCSSYMKTPNISSSWTMLNARWRNWSLQSWDGWTPTTSTWNWCLLEATRIYQTTGSLMTQSTTLRALWRMMRTRTVWIQTPGSMWLLIWKWMMRNLLPMIYWMGSGLFRTLVTGRYTTCSCSTAWMLSTPWTASRASWRRRPTSLPGVTICTWKTTPFTSAFVHLEGHRKKRKCTMSEMKVKKDDVNMVVDCFKIEAFNDEAWLETLSKEQLDAYYKSLKDMKGFPQQVQCTVDNIRELRALKDWDFLGFWNSFSVTFPLNFPLGKVQLSQRESGKTPAE